MADGRSASEPFHPASPSHQHEHPATSWWLSDYTARAMTTSSPSPLDLDHATMQRLGRQVADSVAAHLASLRDQRVLTNGLPAEARQRVTASPDGARIAFMRDRDDGGADVWVMAKDGTGARCVTCKAPFR